jgi:hypothetical protein
MELPRGVHSMVVVVHGYMECETMLSSLTLSLATDDANALCMFVSEADVALYCVPNF